MHDMRNSKLRNSLSLWCIHSFQVTGSVPSSGPFNDCLTMNNVLAPGGWIQKSMSSCGTTTRRKTAFLILSVALCTVTHCTRPIRPSGAPIAMDISMPCETLKDRLPEVVEGFSLARAGATSCFSQDNLWEHMDGGAHEFIRLGFDWLMTAWYEGTGADRRVLVEVFCMQTPPAADTGFRHFLFPDAKTGTLCGTSQIQGNFAFAHKGVYFVRVTAHHYDDRTHQLLEQMIRRLCTILND